MQDRLCSLSTGGGFAVRRLYSNDEEYSLKLQRPVIINGIVGVVTRADLLDRTLSLELPRLDERLTASDMSKAFDRDHPHILAGLFDLLSKVLNLLPSIKIHSKKLPRLGDFALLGEAVYIACGRESNEFLTDFNENRCRGIHRNIDSSPVGQALMSYMETNSTGEFKGTVKQLLEAIENFKPSGENWVRSPRGLGDELRRLGPALRTLSIEVSMDSRAKRDGYHVHIRMTDINQENAGDDHDRNCEHVNIVNDESEFKNTQEEFF